MMAYWKEKLSTIQFIHWPKKELNKQKNKLASQLKNAATSKSTRGFHYFPPLDATTLGMKCISEETEFKLRVKLNISKDDPFLTQDAHRASLRP